MAPVPKWIVGTSTAARIAALHGDDVLTVDPRRERAHPRVEELDHVGAGAHLGRHVRGEGLGQLREEGVPRLGLGEHQRLGSRQLAARAPLDQIPGNGERPSAEADHGLVPIELGADEAHGLEHRLERLLGIGDVESRDVRGAPDRALDDRADALDELDVDPHAEDGSHDVREQHRRIDAVAPHGLEGHLGAQLGRPRDLEERVALADRAILGERAPGLAHEPHRGALDRLPARGTDEKRGDHDGRVALARGTRP